MSSPSSIILQISSRWSVNFVVAIAFAMTFTISPPSILLPVLGLMIGHLSVVVALNWRHIDALFWVVLVFLFVSATSAAQAVFGLTPEIYGGGLRDAFNTHDAQVRTLYIIVLGMYPLIPYIAGRPCKLVWPRKALKNKIRVLFFAGLAAVSFFGNPLGTLLTSSYGNEMYSHWAPGSELIGGWGLLFVILFAAYAYKTRFSSIYDLCFTALIVAYWLLHGKRGEIVGVIAVVFIARYALLSRTRKLVMVIAAIAAVAAFQVIGEVRGLDVVTWYDIYKLVITDKVALKDGTLYVSTADPVNYSLLSTIEGIRSHALDYAYFDYFGSFVTRILPSTWDLGYTRAEDLAVILDRMFSAQGGANFTGEAYYSFGPYGVIGYAAAVFALLGRVRRLQQWYALEAVFYLVLLMFVPRFIWYGSIYLFKIVVCYGGLAAIRWAWRFWSPSRTRGRKSHGFAVRSPDMTDRLRAGGGPRVRGTISVPKAEG